MPQHLLMPALSPGMTEGRIARWLKAEGDAVRAGEVIAEIETDKATLDLESSAAGFLGRILVTAGTAAAVNAPIAVLLRDGEPASSVNAAPAPIATPEQPCPRVFASPIARRLARELDLDLANIPGTGPGGRVVRADVEGARASRVRAAPAPSLPPTPGPTPAGGPVARPAPWQATTPIPNSAARSVIARRLVQSRQTIPHYDLTVDAEVDALLDLRKRFNRRPGAEDLFTVTDLVVKAVALALRQVPAANATWTDEAILRFEAVDVAVAVATESGLVTPVVRHADQKSLAEISRELKALAGKARSGRLKPEEYQGGGFTVSNLGMHGIREFAAIINPPQSCILAIGVAEPRPVVRDGAVVVRTLMTCTLSADHRTVDGAVGAAFLAAFRSRVEDPLPLFL